MPVFIIPLILINLSFPFSFLQQQNELKKPDKSPVITNNKIDSGLVIYMPFDGNTLDYSGRNNHGYGINLLWSEDRFGNAFSACNLQAHKSVLRIPFSSDFDFSTSKELSVGIWANTNQMNLGSSSTMECLSCFEFHIRPYGDKTKLSVKGSTAWFIFYALELKKSGWRQYFFTVDEKQITFYINAEHIDTQAAYYMRWRLPSMHDLFISIYEHDQGAIDNLRIYKRKLSHEEIEKLYNEKR